MLGTPFDLPKLFCGTKRRGRKNCVPGVGESLLVIQRRDDDPTSIVIDLEQHGKLGSGQGTTDPTMPEAAVAVGASPLDYRGDGLVACRKLYS